MMSLLAAVSGALIVAGILGVAIGLHRTPERAFAPSRTRPSLSRWPTLSARTRTLLLIGSAVGVLVALLTGWLIALVLAPAVLAGLPVLLSAPAAAAKINRIEAMEEWSRSISGVLTVGIGLEEALIAT